MPETTSDSSTSPVGPHIAVLAFPFGGHAAPLLEFVRLLAAAAPGVHFSFFSTPQSNATATASSGSNVRVYDVEDGVPEGYTFTGHPEERIELFTEVAPAAFRVAIAAAEVEVGRGVSCVVGDAMLWFAADIAEEMGVPWVAFWAAAPAAIVSHLYSNAIRHKFGAGVGKPGHEDKTLEFIPGMSKIRIRDLPHGIVVGNLESVFPKWLHQMGLTLPRATALFMNTFEELDPPIVSQLKSKLKNVLAVGHSNFHQPSGQRPPTPDPNGCIPWLDKHKPASVVYVSFGSAFLPPPPELKALAEALEATELPFLMSLRDHARAHLPQGFPPAKGKVVSWAPQTGVLAHWAVGAFVTHCGWNSVLESIAGVVPMICRPLFADNPLNGRMVESAWGIGVGVEGGVITKSGLMKSMDLVLSQEQGQHMKTKLRKVKELAENAVRPNGSSAKNLNTLLEIIIRPKNSTA